MEYHNGVLAFHTEYQGEIQALEGSLWSWVLVISATLQLNHLLGFLNLMFNQNNFQINYSFGH